MAGSWGGACHVARAPVAQAINLFAVRIWKRRPYGSVPGPLGSAEPLCWWEQW